DTSRLHDSLPISRPAAGAIHIIGLVAGIVQNIGIAKSDGKRIPERFLRTQPTHGSQQDKKEKYYHFAFLLLFNGKQDHRPDTPPAFPTDGTTWRQSVPSTIGVQCSPKNRQTSPNKQQTESRRAGEDRGDRKKHRRTDRGIIGNRKHGRIGGAESGDSGRYT